MSQHVDFVTDTNGKRVMRVPIEGTGTFRHLTVSKRRPVHVQRLANRVVSYTEDGKEVFRLYDIGMPLACADEGLGEMFAWPTTGSRFDVFKTNTGLSRVTAWRRHINGFRYTFWHKVSIDGKEAVVAGGKDGTPGPDEHFIKLPFS